MTMNILGQYLTCPASYVESFHTFLTGCLDEKNPIYYIPFDVKELIFKELLVIDKPTCIEEKINPQNGEKRVVYIWYYTVSVKDLLLKITHRDDDKPSYIDIRSDIISISWFIDGCLNRQNEKDPVIIDYSVKTERVISKEWTRPHYLPYKIEVENESYMCYFRPDNNHNTNQVIIYSIDTLPGVYNW